MATSFDVRTQYLVFGFIRLIDIQTHIVPSSIILLCVKFYHSRLRIIHFRERYDVIGDFPQINIADMDQNKSYICKVKELSNGSWNKHDVDNVGVCYVKNFKLPRNIINLYNDKNINIKSSYDIIFVIGTEYTSHAYIIDIHNNTNQDCVKAYTWRLPKILRAIPGTQAVYSYKYGLIDVGGRDKQKTDPSLNILSFNDDIKDKNEWNWKRIDRMKKPRRYLAADMLDDDKLIICGGYNNGPSVYVAYADIYDFKEKKWTRLPDMKQERCRAGIYVDRYEKNRVYIIGGKIATLKGLNKCEYYDVIKNNWYDLTDTIGKHGANPSIWIENRNIIHVGSAFCNSFEKMDIREGKWTEYVNRAHFKSVFGVQIPVRNTSSHLCVSV